MELYIAFIAIIILLSLAVECPIARYLTGYSWPAAILLILVSTLVFLFIGPLLTLPYLHDIETAPTAENYLKLYVTYVFIKTVADIFFLQITTTMFFSTTVSAPPFLASFKLLFIANLGVITIIAGLYVYNVIPALLTAIGITMA
jgi:hypothetical protein